MVTNHKSWALFFACAILMMASVAQAQVLENLPYSGGVLAARAIRAGRIQIPHQDINPTGVADLACSPAPCLFTPVQVSAGPSMVDEYPIAANPDNPLQLLSGGNDYNCPNIQGWYSSNDGGSTWTRKCSTGSNGLGDPIVAYANNVAFAGGIQNNSIVVASSTDNGQNWGTPKVAAPALLGYLADKPWLEADNNAASPFHGSLYVSATQFASSSNSEISVSHSTDGGNTWTTKVVDTQQVFPKVDQFTDLAVGADGTVYVSWQRCTANGPSGDCANTTATMVLSKSTDGGNTWSVPVTIATTKLSPDPNFCCFYGALPVTSFERVSNIPSTAAFGSGATAKVYVSFYNWTGSQMQVMLATSSDGGNTFGVPVRATASNKGDQFFQWVNVSSNGKKIAVTWLDRRGDPANQKYQPAYATTANGTTFGPSRALTTTLSDPLKDGFGGGFMGDYNTNVWDGKAFYTVWPDTRSGIIQDEIGGQQF